MAQETINLYTALREMDKAKQPFSVQFVEYSRTKQTGGAIRKLHNVLTVGQQKGSQTNNMIAFKQADTPDGDIRRCWIWAIQEFNGKTITL